MTTTLEISSEFILNVRNKLDKKPLVVGVQGLQGSGKSTLVKALQDKLESSQGLRVIYLSIDDLYLTRQEIIDLYRETSNILYEKRGLPGTHDIALGISILEQLLARHEMIVKLPVYNKSLYNGQGDREPLKRWKEVKTPFDVIIIEGWMLGYEALSKEELFRKYEVLEEKSWLSMKDLNQVNGNLIKYRQWTDRLDCLIYITTTNLENVLEWRWQQERGLIESTGSGMSKEEVKNFVSRFMICYKLYYEDYQQNDHVLNCSLKIEINSNRNVIRYRNQGIN